MPEISIIIPVFNCLALTQACLKSLEETIGFRADFEVILIDNASTDGTPEWLATLPAPRYRVIRNEINLGYAGANNAAARLAEGRLLLLLNNDTVLLPGWLEPMLRVLAHAQKAGLVGNVQREAESGLIDHAGILFTSDGTPQHFGMDTVTPPPEEFRRFPAVTGACWLVPRDLFVRLGGFNEDYRNGFEDVDFCLRLRREGYFCYVANRSVIYHHVSATPGRREADHENFARFARTWHSLGMKAERQEAMLRQERRRDGWRYMKKHWWRPWRYNAERLRQAAEKIATPRPAAPAVKKREPSFFD